MVNRGEFYVVQFFHVTTHYAGADHRAQWHLLKFLCGYPAVECLYQPQWCGGAVFGAGQLQLHIRDGQLLIGVDLRHKLYANIG